MSNNYETRVIRLLVVPKEDHVYSEMATQVIIDDKGAGEFVSVIQDKGEIRIAPEEWRPLCDAINKMIEQCRNPQ